MKKYFQIKLEFNQETIHQKIHQTVSGNKKGYVCVVDGNVLAKSVKDIKYRNIINNALVNTCDGSSIAFFASLIHGRKFSTYTGPDLFKNLTSKPYSQLFLGNTFEIHKLLKDKFHTASIDTSQMIFETLPFKKVDEFDYVYISKKINRLKPDIIWVSLGAPKQELFINKLYPFVDSGILIAIGAAFNSYVNIKNHKRAPSFFLKLNLEWLYRSIKNPNRIGKRALNYALLLPRIIINEIKKVHFSK